ncbi:MAG: 2-C-methyl-D-erythritol 4-phosphate cytidylyltransferase [Lautropia sp.]
MNFSGSAATAANGPVGLADAGPQTATTRPADHVVLIPAGGSGSRIGSPTPKQYLELQGRTVLECTTQVFVEQDWIERVLIVVQPDDAWAQRLVRLEHPKITILREAGATRRDTVLNGLAAAARLSLLQPHDWIYVHDAARPGLDAASLQRLAASLDDERCGALLCLPVTDTVKRVDPIASDFANARLRSAGTVDRSRLWLAQTPQVFRAGPLRRALEQHPSVTDEASAIEAEGGRPRLITGTRLNQKITTVEDLIIMRVLLDHTARAQAGR